jgi:hypothetical protein
MSVRIAVALFLVCGLATGQGTAPTLSMTQPAGPGSLDLRNSGGDPGYFYFIAVSFDVENVLSPGQGWWGGLHIGIVDIRAELSYGYPFTGLLDSQGDSAYVVPAGVIPAGISLHAVSRTFDPTTFYLSATSNLVTLLTQ